MMMDTGNLFVFIFNLAPNFQILTACFAERSDINVKNEKIQRNSKSNYEKLEREFRLISFSFRTKMNSDSISDNKYCCQSVYSV